VITFLTCLVWHLVTMERGPLSLVGTAEELTVICVAGKRCVTIEVRTELLNIV
jgi:hypothetical protein